MIKLKAQHISVNDNIILKDLHFTIANGEILIIIGKNGSGKSTLLKYLMGLLKSNGGHVFYDDINIFSHRNEIAEHLGALFVNQDCYSHLTVYENLKIYANYLKIKIFDWDEYLAKYGLIEVKNIKFSNLSSGNKQKTNLAILFLDDPKYIFLDEPFLTLDRNSIIEIKEILKRESKSNHKLILIATHDFEIVEDLYTRVIYLKNQLIFRDMACQEVKNEFGTLSNLYSS